MKNIFKKISDSLLYKYLIKTMNGMAYGLFATLIVGTILGTIGNLLEFDKLIYLANLLKSLMGVGIGVGVAWSLKLDGLRLISAAVAGGIATMPRFETDAGILFGRPGDPLVAFLVVIIAIEVTRLILSKKTPVDIIIIPLLSSLIAYSVYLVINQPISEMMSQLGNFVRWATEMQPFIMGVLIAVVMGMILTAPISSAAIAIMISLGGIAGGAAVVGCSVQMLGFAVMSRKDNNIGTVISVGIGTSMLQFKNVMKKPIIWLPTIIVSAILGPLSTIVFKTETNDYGAGMGTSGLVGQFATFEAMGNTSAFWLSVLVLHVALPIVLVYILDLIFRMKGLIKPGDLTI